MSEESKPMTLFDVFFDVVLPGNTKPTTCKITVKAEDQFAAHLTAREQYELAVSKYDVRIRESRESGKITVGS